MAKQNKQVPRGTFQPVYSNQFLVDGTWYVTVVCPVHGLADEEIPWEEAKTPHHAGVIADSRHIACSLEKDKELEAEARKAEIEIARREVERVDALLAEAQKKLEAIQAMSDADPNRETMLAEVRMRVEYYSKSPVEARRRLAETEAANGGST